MFKDRVTKNLVDQGSALEVEIMLSKVQANDMHQHIIDLSKASASTDVIIKEQMSKLLAEGGSAGGNPELNDMRKKQLNE
jgi:hypothetical protein